MTQNIIYNLAFRNPKQWVEEEKNNLDVALIDCHTDNLDNLNDHSMH